MITAARAAIRKQDIAESSADQPGGVSPPMSCDVPTRKIIDDDAGRFNRRR
jgi:hypothetical protein